MHTEIVCRVCLSECDKLTPLRETLPGENRTILETINFVVNINIKLEDGFPDKICQNCESTLNVADAFKWRCLESEEILSQQEKSYELQLEFENQENTSEDTSITCISLTDSSSEDEESSYDFQHEIKLEIEEILDDDKIFQNKTPNQKVTPSEDLEINNDDSNKSKNHSDNEDINKSQLASENVTNDQGISSVSDESHQDKDTTGSIQQSAAQEMEKFECFDCKATFTSMDDIKLHIRTHSKPAVKKTKVYSCKYCGKDFSSRDGLKTHRLEHWQEDAPRLTRSQLREIQSIMMEITPSATKERHTDDSTTKTTEDDDYVENDENNCIISKKELEKNVKLDNINRKSVDETKKKTTGINQSIMVEITPSATKERQTDDSTTKTTQDVENDENNCIVRKKQLEKNVKPDNNNRKIMDEAKKKTTGIMKLNNDNTKCVDKAKKKTTGVMNLNNKNTKCVDEAKKKTMIRYTIKRTAVSKVTSYSEILTCDICDYTTFDLNNLDLHLKAHTTKKQYTKKPYSCDLCSYLNMDQKSYKSHLRTHIGRYSCHICNKILRDKSSLDYHVKAHSGVKSYCCNTCGKSYSYKCALVRHLNAHTGNARPFSCNICKRKFSQKPNLERHIAIRHTGDYTPIFCNVCGKKFSQKPNLERHLLVHSGDKPYTCYVCHRKFRQKPHLDTHVRTHTGEKPFSCLICGKRFCRKDALNVHIRSHTRKMLFGRLPRK